LFNAYAPPIPFAAAQTGAAGSGGPSPFEHEPPRNQEEYNHGCDGVDAVHEASGVSAAPILFGLARDFGRFRILDLLGRDLRERYEVPKELPPKLVSLVRKLDDRDWLLPSANGPNDVDLFGG